MLRKIFPLVLALIGLSIGTGIGWYLRPAPPPDAAAGAGAEKAPPTPEERAKAAEADPAAAPEYVKLNNQFVVPVMQDGKVAAMVVLALSLEVTHGSTEAVYAREPKLRDAILQVLFDHANSGGFAGEFTDGSNLVLLRKALLEKAQSTLGDLVLDVLISDIARQDS